MLFRSCGKPLEAKDYSSMSRRGPSKIRRALFSGYARVCEESKSQGGRFLPAGVPVLCPRVPATAQQDPTTPNGAQRAKLRRDKHSAHLRALSSRTENPGVGGSIPSLPTIFSPTSE